ncbi:TetR/AcrR family transcriptional regulator [Actinotalea sp. Marseille-Q4924]|uniref:TetR/AcrR family transcriptional regulator n=1 Tax=Actinotalea sp. Marseille-Q4924 TaxID=2866571 RepID=UPI001CE4AED3|nr:TetR/AcrR family transcriptional regulator [Actinotalea sp. Marseille-Q4924]
MSPVTAATTPGETPVDGRSARWDVHRAARRAELARVARKAVHLRGPDVSMDEIATEAGTSKSVVYRYFVDKSGLQAAVGEVVLDDMHARLDEAVSSAVTPREGLRSMIAAYLEMIDGSPSVYWFVTQPVAEGSSVTLNRFLDDIATLIARPFVALLRGRGGASVLEGQPADVWSAGAVGFVKGAGDWWLAHRDEPGAPTADELAERVTAWLWAGPVGSLARPLPADTTTDPAPVHLDDEEPS